MNEIWANRLIAGTKTWAELPASRRKAVQQELADRVESEAITAGQYAEITGEEYMEVARDGRTAAESVLQGEPS